MAFGEGFSDRVTSAVAAIEQASDAEVVVVVAPRSGSYADVDLLAAIFLGLLSLGVILYGPWSFRPEPILADVLIFGLLGWAASRRFPALRRLLTRERRRQAQVEMAARLAFMDYGVHATRGRTGVLIYLSQLERSGRVLADQGVHGKVPRAVWSELKQGLSKAASLGELESALHQGLELMAQRLPAHLPATGENPDEIPNAPRILP